MIPKIIHQTWKTKQLPEEFQNWHNQIIALHPGWDIRLWTDEDNLELVKEHFPYLHDIYENLEYNIMRADIIRYMYMVKFGGYYLDLDYELFTPFDSKTPDVDLILPLSGEYGGKTIIGNSIFGSVPQHEFWKDVLTDFYQNPPIKKFFNKFEVLKLTGPDFISEIYYKSPEKYKGYLVPKNIYHPDNKLVKKNNYKKGLETKGSMGIHHCQGTWLKDNNSLINIISRANSSVRRRFTNLIKTR